MSEGTLAKWLVSEGDDVAAGDVLAEIETDKATMEFEAVDEGKIVKILVAEGSDNVPVNEMIAVLAEEGEDPDNIDLSDLTGGNGAANENAEADPAQSETAAAPASPQAAEAAASTPSPAAAAASAAQNEGRIFASPLARRLAEEKGIALDQVNGSGPHGRIVKKDIETFQPKAQAHPVTATGQTQPGTAAAGASEERDDYGFPLYTVEKPNNVRKVVAERLTESKQTVPHFYLNVDVEVDHLLAFRKRLNQRGEQDGFKVSVNDIIIKACAEALMARPHCNTAWTGEGLRFYSTADVSVAVAVEGGLITPVIRNAQTKGLVQISGEMKELAKKARDGKLQPQEFDGGTFTVSNLGMFGIDHFSAIINPPQGAILAIGQSTEKPVVKDGQLTTATVMTLTLSIDHRAIDGAVGAEFLQVIKSYLEDPAMMVA